MVMVYKTYGKYEKIWNTCQRYASWKNKNYGMSVLMPILSRSYKANRHLITYEIL